MKLINELLGFAVLTSPLFLIVLWVPLCFGLAVLVSRKLLKTAKTGVRVTVGALVFVLALVVPVGDEIAGRIYFNHLCETEAGAKVYQTIELPAEYWDEEGKPKFYKGAMNNDVPDYAFDRLGIPVDIASSDHHRLFHVDQFGAIIKDNNTGRKISDITGFLYWGGWISRNLTTHNSAISCGGSSSYDELIEKQFKRKSNIMGSK